MEPVLYGLVEKWADRLGLGNWRIQIRIHSFAEGAHAEAEWPEYADEATITFQPTVLGPDWLGDRLEALVVHELLHLVLRDYRRVVDDVEDLLDHAAFAIHEQAYKRIDEQTVDRLAWSLVRAFRFRQGGPTNHEHG